MGNVNRKWYWVKEMKQYEKIIRDGFIFHDRFAKNGDKIFAKIRHVITQRKTKHHGRRKNIKNQKMSYPSPNLVFVGVHIRWEILPIKLWIWSIQVKSTKFGPPSCISAYFLLLGERMHKAVMLKNITSQNWNLVITLLQWNYIWTISNQQIQHQR